MLLCAVGRARWIAVNPIGDKVGALHLRMGSCVAALPVLLAARWGRPAGVRRRFASFDTPTRGPERLACHRNPSRGDRQPGRSETVATRVGFGRCRDECRRADVPGVRWTDGRPLPRISRGNF